MARALGLSGRSLQRRLAADGGGFAATLAQVRLRAALLMLLNGEARPAQIGFAAGFADQAHMARAVKRATGLTPLALRREPARFGALVQ